MKRISLIAWSNLESKLCLRLQCSVCPSSTGCTERLWCDFDESRMTSEFSSLDASFCACQATFTAFANQRISAIFWYVCLLYGTFFSDFRDIVRIGMDVTLRMGNTNFEWQIRRETVRIENDIRCAWLVSFLVEERKKKKAGPSREKDESAPIMPSKQAGNLQDQIRPFFLFSLRQLLDSDDGWERVPTSFTMVICYKFFFFTTLSVIWLCQLILGVYRSMSTCRSDRAE